MSILAVTVAVLGASWLVRMARRAETRARLAGPAPGRRLPGRMREPLAAALGEAGVTLAPEDAAAGWLAATGALAALVAFADPGLGVVAGVSGLAAGPVVLWLLRGRRQRRLRQALPGLLEQVAHELRGAGTVATALDRLADQPGPAAAMAGSVRARTRLGLALTEALDRGTAPPGADLATRADVDAALGALRVAAGVGGPAADPLDGMAAALRDRQAVAAEARALSAQARLSALVVGLLPLVSLGYSLAVDRRTVAVLTGTPLGRLALTAGLALQALAALWMRRIVRVAA